MMYKNRLLVIFFLLFCVSCKKKIEGITTIPVNASAGIPAYPFNWETADRMPTPAGTTILVPWASGSVKGFSSDIWYDFKKTDGWELVYNVFNTTSLQSNPFFVLYNKYRGLLRYYVYINTGGFTTSSYLTSGLNLAPNSVNSSLLNYVNADLVDVTTNTASVSKTEPTQVATGTWYASQYEMAYDSKTPTYTYGNLGLNWTLKWTNISQVNLGGGLVGSLKGTITTPGTSVNLTSQLKRGALSATGLSVFNDAAGPDATKPENGNLLGLAPIVFKSMRDGLTGGVVGVVKNIFSGIFGLGGSGPSIQSINATFNADITLTGSEASSGAIFPDPGLGLVVPGVSNSQQGIGYIPAYNSPLGVFNLSQKPTINSHMTIVDPTGRPNTRWAYTVAPNTVKVVINPAVSSIAQVTIDKQEIVVAYVSTDVPITDGVKELVGTRSVITVNGFPVPYYSYTNVSYIQVRGGPNGYPFLAGNNTQPSVPAPVAVRITLKIVPNNGSAPFKIAKTFLANQVAI